LTVGFEPNGLGSRIVPAAAVLAKFFASMVNQLAE
jgi:hypothetical protein